MKQPPDDRRKNFETSAFSGDGFLGGDGRSVDEIISDDERALQRAGVSLDALANALDAAYAQCRNALGATVEIIPGVSGVFEESRGRLPCPFRGCGVFEKGEAVIGSGTLAPLIVTSLGIHLIKKHGFFQGSGSRYRIDPADAIKLLHLG